MRFLLFFSKKCDFFIILTKFFFFLFILTVFWFIDFLGIVKTRWWTVITIWRTVRVQDPCRERKDADEGERLRNIAQPTRRGEFKENFWRKFIFLHFFQNLLKNFEIRATIQTENAKFNRPCKIASEIPEKMLAKKIEALEIISFFFVQSFLFRKKE